MLGHEPEDQVRNLVGLFVQREMLRVEQVDIGGRLTEIILLIRDGRVPPQIIRIRRTFLAHPSSEERLALGLTEAGLKIPHGAVGFVRYGARVVVGLLFEEQDSNGRPDSS